MVQMENTMKMISAGNVYATAVRNTRCNSSLSNTMVRFSHVMNHKS
jgi:hypothetical protein